MRGRYNYFRERTSVKKTNNDPLIKSVLFFKKLTGKIKQLNGNQFSVALKNNLDDKVM